MPYQKEPLRIYKEGAFFYIGTPGYFLRTRTGAGLKGLMRAIKAGGKF